MWPTVNSSHTVSIHTLDDDSLLHIFYLYRPVVVFRGKKYDGDDDDDDEEEEEEDRNYGRTRIPEQWWYKLSRVCQRWRKILLGSASYLDLCLVCTYGTPVADMLEHSPPLPLVIDFFRAHWDITTEDEEGIILAFERRDRVRRVRLLITPQNLHNLFVAFFEEYPVLESLIMTLDVPVEHDTAIVLPELQTPHLRHLMLRRFVLPIESRLLATAVGLVTLSLYLRVGFGHFNPDTLFQILQSISFMPQLETLIFVLPCRSSIGLHSMLLGHTSSMTQRATLSNLRRLVFEGVKECIEAVVCHIAAPLLETLDVHVFDQLMLSEFSPHVPGLFQFVKTTENLKFDCAKFKFLKEGVRVDLYPRREAKTHSFSIYVHNNYRRQVYLMADLLNTSIGSGEMFSTVEHLVLEDRVHRSTTDRYSDDRIKWRKFFQPFLNAKTLHVDDGIAKEFFRTLPPESADDGELTLDLPPMPEVLSLLDHRPLPTLDLYRPLPMLEVFANLLPSLEELTYCGWLGSDDTAFTTFIDDGRQNASRLVTMFRSGQVGA